MPSLTRMELVPGHEDVEPQGLGCPKIRHAPVTWITTRAAPMHYRALVHAENPLQHRLLFVTGDTVSPRTLEFLNSSGLPYLAKPFLVEELKESVRRALAAAPAAEEAAAEAGWSRAIARGK